MPGFPTHPGLAWRITRLLPKAAEYLSDQHQSEPWLVGRSQLAEIGDLVPVGEDEIGPVEKRIIEGALGTLEEEAVLRKTLSLRGSYQRGKLAAELDVVWGKLESGIPPAEHVFARTRPGSGGEGPEAKTGLSKLKALLGKASSQEAVGLGTVSLDLWSSPMDWRSVLNGSYLFWLSGRARSPHGSHHTAPISPRAIDDWKAFNEHVRGTIELRTIHERLQNMRDQLDSLGGPDDGPSEITVPPRPERPAGMLSRGELVRRLLDHESGLGLTPIVDAGRQLGPASVDLRLGPDFIVARRATGLATFDPARVDEIEQRVRDYQDYMRRPPGSAFYLHPGEFAIARTFEYVTLPAQTAAQVTGRSSWGRLGLVIATAPLIQAGFQGTITLELANLGSVPIVLYVGVRVAQISYFDIADPASV